MNPKQVKRLRELLAKKVADRSDDESSELKKLLALADEHGVDITAKVPEEKEEAEGLGEAEVKKLITDGVTEGLKKVGIDPEQLGEIKKALDAKPNVTAKEIEEAVSSVLGGKGLDKEALTQMVTEIVTKADKGLTKKDVEEILEVHHKNAQRGASKFQFQVDGQNEMPIEHRSGNLRVSQKQLLNILMEATPGMKEAQIATVMNKDIPDELLRGAVNRGKAHLERLRAKHVYGGKTLTGGTSNEGAELVPTDLSSDLLNRMYLNSAIAAEFIAMEIQMPSDTFELPIRTTRPTFYKGSENPGSNPTESSPGTANVTLAAVKLIGKTNFSYEVDEDAVVAVLPMVTENLASAAADALEGAIINGDTTGTHQDTDFAAVTAHYAKLFKGLRKYALAGSCSTSLATGGISAANLLTLKKNMKRWGVQPRDLLLIAGVNGYNDIIGLDETITADKVGAAARILTGEAPSLYGIRVVVSSQCREDLNASGVNDGVTTTKGSVLLVHKPSWVMGVRRGFTVEVDRDIQQQVNVVVASFRRDFKPMETPSTSLPYVWLGYNYTA